MVLGTVTSALFVIGFLLTSYGSYFTQAPVIVGTGVLCLITFLSFHLSIKNIMHENPHKFVNGVSLATFIKLMLCAIGAVTWIFMNKETFNKPDLFYLMFVYIIFSAVEAVFLSGMSKKRHQGK